MRKQLSGLHNPVYEKEMTDKVAVIKIIIGEMTGKSPVFNRLNLKNKSNSI